MQSAPSIATCPSEGLAFAQQSLRRVELSRVRAPSSRLSLCTSDPVWTFIPRWPSGPGVAIAHLPGEAAGAVRHLVGAEDLLMLWRRAGLDPAEHVYNSRHNVDRHLLSRGVVVNAADLGEGLPIGSLPLEQVTRGRVNGDGSGRVGFEPTGYRKPNLLRPRCRSRATESDRRRCGPEWPRWPGECLSASDRQVVATWGNRNRASDRGAGIAKFRLIRARLPGTRLRSDNQAASARLVETAGLEPATSTFSIILCLRPLTGQVRGEGTAQCSSELSYVSELNQCRRQVGVVGGVFEAVTRSLRPASGGGGCQDSNPDLALNRR